MPAETEQSTWSRIERLAFRVGVAALALFLLSAFFGLAGFARAYLVAYFYWLGFALGSMVLLMVQHLTGGAWGLLIRRILEAGTRTLPLLALLFAPVLMNVQQLYPWAVWSEQRLAESEVLYRKSLYLNVPFFVGRALAYFAVWLGLAYLLNRWSRRQDETADPELPRRLRRISAIGLVLYGATITFAAIDWAMSLEPLWYSTIYGALFGTGQVLTAMSFAILLLIVVLVTARNAGAADSLPQPVPRDPALATLVELASPRRLQDLGSLLLAFVMLWAYMQFSQYLIIWSGNLPEETPWYVSRLEGYWQWAGLLLVLLHFALPFLLLLSKDVKRHARRLANVAVLVLLMRFVETAWLILPAGARSGAWAADQALSALQAVVAALGIGGLWAALFAHELRKRPIVPPADPHLEEALHHA